MKEKKAEFFEFLDNRTAEVLAEADALAGEDRQDESNTMKAKANIYDIFKAIWEASEKMSSEDDFSQVFIGKVDLITMPWGKSLDAAKAHNDIRKIMIEEAKLSAVAEVKEKISSLS